MTAALLLVTTLSAAVEAPPGDPPRPSFNAHRGLLEIGTLVGLGLGWYEWQIELNKNDFDFARTWSDQWRRLTTKQGYRFDDNDRYLNVGHAYMGAAYYQMARTNGASLLQSTLLTAATSTFWEMGVEHREVISVTDQIVTPLGGMPVGESLFQTGELFARSAPTVRNRLLMATFSPLRAVNWALGDKPRTSHTLNAQGIDATTPHYFDLSVGATAGRAGQASADANARASGVRAEVRLDAETMRFPSYGKAGAQSDWHTGGEATRLILDYVQARSDGTGGGFSWSSSTTVWGHYAQEIVGEEQTSRRGSARFLGTKSAFDLAYEPSGDTDDFLMFAHLLGPTADITWFRGPLSVRAVVDGFGDFSLVRPRAVPGGPYPAALAKAKSTLKRFEYYYGWGVTGAARLEASYWHARAGISAEWNHVGSVEGLDRYQDAFSSPVGIRHEAITDDSHLIDDRLKLRVFADLPLPLATFKLGASAELRRRQGSWKAQDSTADDARISFLLTYAL